MKNKEIKLDSKQKKIVIGVAVAVLVIVIAIIAAVTNKPSNNKQTETANGAQQTATAGEAGNNGEEGLQKNTHEDVNKLVKEYLTACKDGNMTAIEKVVSNGEELTKEQVQKPYEYVENIQNIDCYTLKGAEEGSYIVYVYYELKFVNIDTLAPGLLQLYVSTTSDNSLVILLSDLDKSVENARNKALERTDVKELIATANSKLTEAANKDAKLKELITKFNSAEAQAAKKATAAPKATATPKATKAPKK